jgi:hypothetical protein
LKNLVCVGRKRRGWGEEEGGGEIYIGIIQN